MEEIASVNKQISDGASSLTKTLSGSDNSSSDGGMPHLVPGQQLAKQSTSKNYDIPVDVDTAAARIQRYYKFTTTEELENLRNSHDSSKKVVASAIEEEHPVWSVTPGSYYKMGSDWEDESHVDIEVEKNVAGSKLYITYSSSNPRNLTSEYLEPLYVKIKRIAEGTIR
jgi:hypothetical protein